MNKIELMTVTAKCDSCGAGGECVTPTNYAAAFLCEECAEGADWQAYQAAAGDDEKSDPYFTRWDY